MAGTSHARTAAGTQILNIAQASFVDENGATQMIMSNPVTFRVEEVIDLSLDKVGVVPLIAQPGDADRSVQFRLTNLGNGPERFVLAFDDALSGDDFDPDVQSIFIDSNGNGRFDPLEDLEYIPGREPDLTPDQIIDLFVIADVPVDARDADEGYLTLTATAETGSGTPGTLFDNAGEGGVDALIGLTTARETRRGEFLIAAPQPLLAKAQSLSGDPVGGSTVTYTLTADYRGADLPDARVTDVIPAGTSFLPGSITLNGTSLSDAADSDAGRFDGTQISVALAERVSAPQVITFQVVLN
ncbi:MAG: hypothetical protein WA979_11495 [Pacificimonas sp.]